MSFSVAGIIIICCTAFLTGISRTGLPGLGILLVSLVAMAMPVRESSGFLLPLLVEADLMSVLYFRRKAAWSHLFRVLPWTALGVVAGFFFMKLVSGSLYKPLLGAMIVIFVVLDLARRWAGIEIKSGSKGVACAIGILAGAFTMIANAAGPIMANYMLSMDLPKEEFVGTSSVFFFIINLFKVPFSVALGLITWQSLKVGLMLIPLIGFGVFAGIVFLKKIPQKVFYAIVQALAALGGIKLLF